MRFPEFSGEWAEFTLSQLGDMYNGLNGKSGADFGHGYPYITYKSVFDSYSVDINRVEYVNISKEEISNGTQNKVQCGDVFFTTSSETPEEVGMSSVLLEDVGTCFLNSFCFGFRPKSLIQTSPKYLQFYFRSNLFRWKMIALAQGSTRYNISKSGISKIVIHLPCFEEQNKIASFLSLIDKRISTQIRVIEDLKTLKKAITNSIINDLLLELPPIPFAEIYVSAGEGGTPDTKKKEYYNNGNIPFIKIDDLTHKYLTCNKDYINEIGLRKSSAWIVPTNSIIFSNGATIGAISINKYPVATKQGILGIVPKSNINVEYLYYLMSSIYFQRQIHRIVTQGTMATVYLKDINKIKIPVPSIEKQNRLAQVLSVISQKEELEQIMLDKLHIQKQYLLQKMFI